MKSSNSFVIFVERGPFGAMRNRFLIKDPQTNSVKLFSCAIAAADFVEHLEGFDAFDRKDKIVVMHKDHTPELGWHCRAWGTPK